MFQKNGSMQLNSLEEFKDDLIFEYEFTGDNLLFYCEDMETLELEDYQGNIATVTEKSGCALFPNTYKLGKSEEYMLLVTSYSSNRAIYKE